jgi:hypothetical protein
MAVGCTSTSSANRRRSLEAGSGRWRPTNTNSPECRAGLPGAPFHPRRERSAGVERVFWQVHSRLANGCAPDNWGIRKKPTLLGRRARRLAGAHDGCLQTEECPSGASSPRACPSESATETRSGASGWDEGIRVGTAPRLAPTPKRIHRRFSKRLPASGAKPCLPPQALLTCAPIA